MCVFHLSSTAVVSALKKCVVTLQAGTSLAEKRDERTSVSRDAHVGLAFAEKVLP